MRHNRTLMRRLRQGVIALEAYCESLGMQIENLDDVNRSEHGRIKHMIERTGENLESSIQWAKDDLRSRIDQVDREVDSVRRSIPSGSGYGRW